MAENMTLSPELLVILALAVLLTGMIGFFGLLVARRLAQTPMEILDASTWGGIMAQLQKQLETRDQKIAALENEGEKLRAEVERLRQDVQIWQTKASDLQTALKVFTLQMHENQARMTSLEHEMETLRLENQRLKEAINAPVGKRDILAARFNPEEIKALCQDLEVDYDSLPGEGHAGKVRALIDYIARRGEIPRLLAAARKARPDVNLGS